eukprot:4320113-Amphidinium_carterae.1
MCGYDPSKTWSPGFVLRQSFSLDAFSQWKGGRIGVSILFDLFSSGCRDLKQVQLPVIRNVVEVDHRMTRWVPLQLQPYCLVISVWNGVHFMFTWAGSSMQVKLSLPAHVCVCARS